MPLTSYTHDGGIYWHDEDNVTITTGTKTELDRGTVADQIHDYLLFFAEHPGDPVAARARRRRFRARQRALRSKPNRAAAPVPAAEPPSKPTPPSKPAPPRTGGDLPSTAPRAVFTRLVNRVRAARTWVDAAPTPKERRRRQRFLRKQGHDAERLRLSELQQATNGFFVN